MVHRDSDGLPLSLSFPYTPQHPTDIDDNEAPDIDLEGNEDEVLDKIQRSIPTSRGRWPKGLWEKLRELSKERFVEEKREAWGIIDRVLALYFINAKSQGYSVGEISELANVPVVNVIYLVKTMKEVEPEQPRQPIPKKSPVYS